MIRARSANVTFLYSHGNAEDLNSSYSWMRRLSRELNVNVIGYDYTGYGLSTGKHVVGSSPFGAAGNALLSTIHVRTHTNTHIHFTT